MARALFSPFLLGLLAATYKSSYALTLNRRQVELPGTWAAQGCYTDISSGRTLIAASFAGPTMTVESCLAFCTDAGCDFAIQNPGVPAEDTDCNIPCAGDPLEICGAGGRLSMYHDGTPDPVIVPTVDTWTYKGCFQDSAGSRLLLERIDGPGPLTPAQCTSTCKAHGYNFTGLEFSLECWCGHGLANPVLEDDSDCKMACVGDRTAFCGGSNRISVYEDTPPVDPTPTDPLPTDPLPTDPTPTDPLPTDPLPTDPTPTDPLPTDPLPTDPTPTDPTPTDPLPTDPLPTDPTPTDPLPTDPLPTDPIPTDPLPTDPLPTDPAPTDPLPTDPLPTDPTPTDPLPTDPLPTDPIPTDPLPTDPLPTDPTPEPIPTEEA